MATVTDMRIAVHELRKEFGGGEEAVLALDQVNLEIGRNEFVSLLGTSGCGKSSLLAILGGLQQASSGSIEVDGLPIAGPGRDRGFVFQAYTLFPWMTIQQNVEFALRLEPMSKAERADTARESLALVGLENFLGAYPKQLSGGMKQRAAIARALSYRPEILLMDEPFGALDAQTRQLMQELLTQIWERHQLTVLFVTHDIDEAVFLSDRAILMTARPGRVKRDMRIELERPRTFRLLGSPEFLAYKAELLELVREETLKTAGSLANVLEHTGGGA